MSVRRSRCAAGVMRCLSVSLASAFLLAALVVGAEETDDAASAPENQLARAEPDPQELRTRTEWVGLRSGGGWGGLYLSVNAFTLRWEWLYWDILRFSMIGMAGDVDLGAIGWGGTAFGLPLISDDGRNELRIGVEIGIGALLPVERDEGDEDGEPADWGPNEVIVLVTPQLCYVWHFERFFAFVIGLGAHFPVAGQDDYSGVAGLGESPAINLFLGVVI